MKMEIMATVGLSLCDAKSFCCLFSVEAGRPCLRYDAMSTTITIELTEKIIDRYRLAKSDGNRVSMIHLVMSSPIVDHSLQSFAFSSI